MRPVILLGVKHCGKTTLGKLLAARRGAEFIDIDDLIAAQAGMSPREVFLSQGEEGFMAAEWGACKAAAEKISPPGKGGEGRGFVVACGGGVCDNPQALEALKGAGLFVFIDAPEETVAARILSRAVETPGGPLGNLPAYIAKDKPRTREEARRLFHPVFERRRAAYRLLAQAVFEPQDCPAEQNGEKLSQILLFLDK